MKIEGLKIDGIELKPNTNVLDIKVPEWLKNRIMCGIPWIDEAVGGGFLATQVLMFTGDPGSGKTTVSLQLADAITGSNNICVFNSGEESPAQVALKAERLGIKHGFILAQHIFAEDLFNQLDHLRKEPKNKDKHVFIIQDSLPTLDDGYYRGKKGSKDENRSCINGATPARAMKKLTDWAKTNHGTVLTINHVTKGGQFAGKNEIKHMIDAHLELKVNKEDNSRVFSVSKNRFGDTSSEYVVGMHAQGLHLINKIDKSADLGVSDEAEEELAAAVEKDAVDNGTKKRRKRRSMGLKAV